MKNTWGFLATSLAIVGITFNVIFYTVIGGGGIYSVLYSISGLLLDTTKFSLVIGVVAFVAAGMVFEAIIAGVLFIALTLLSLGAGFGFLSNAIEQDESKNLLSSNIYETHQAAVESANARVETYAKFADSSSAELAEQQNSQINDELDDILNSTATNSKGNNAGTVASRVGDCTGNGFYIRKYCPSIRVLEKKKERKGQAVINGHQMYLAALAHRNTALENLSNMTTENTTGIINTMFINASVILDISPENAKIGFMGLTATLIELAASILFYLKARLFGVPITHRTEQETEQETEHFASSEGLQISELQLKKNNLKPSLNPILKPIAKSSPMLVNSTSNKLYQEAENAIKSGSLKPSLAALRKWKKAKGKKLTDTTIKLWQQSLYEKGIIEICKLPNGLDTYKLS